MEEYKLNSIQEKAMRNFYSKPAMKVIFDKKARKRIWNIYKSGNNSVEDDANYEITCPALADQIRKSIEMNHLIQSAVFSECAYSQTFANSLGLTIFINCLIHSDELPINIQKICEEYKIYPRYAYTDENKTKFLIQAGSCHGIDALFINLDDASDFLKIEFKEPAAKTSEPDLPFYDYDGLLNITDVWLTAYPQFRKMVEEKINLNFFEHLGSNINDFLAENVEYAVTNNYNSNSSSGDSYVKEADVIITEDKNGKLVMIPSNHVVLWAKLEGEIRPAGRNHYKVWTEGKLRNVLQDLGAIINENNDVIVNKTKLKSRKARGANKVTGYKINEIFFVYVEDVKEVVDNLITFNINKVQQLKPTIAAKMFFKNLKYENVKKKYNL